MLFPCSVQHLPTPLFCGADMPDATGIAQLIQVILYSIGSDPQTFR